MACKGGAVAGTIDGIVELVEGGRLLAVDLPPPDADKVLLAENGPIGA